MPLLSKLLLWACLLINQHREREQELTQRQKATPLWARHSFAFALSFQVCKWNKSVV